MEVEYRLREIDGMMQVYVPAGEYPMGYSTEQIELLSQICEEHKSSLKDYGSTDCSFISFIEAKDESAYTDGFWIDQTEVTNSMYEKCRLSGACPSFVKRSFTRQVYSRDPQFADFPMMYAYLEEAHTYCEWVGGRLPIFTEWKMAALGTDGRLFPWGNSPPSDELLNYYGSKIGDSVAVGSYPNGRSPFGALDLLGNVSEWLSDSECFVDDEFQWEWCGYVGGDARDGFNSIFFRPTFDQPGGSTGQGFRCVNEP
jgi:formylglycine-generating enzyme required for sulfatase activity